MYYMSLCVMCRSNLNVTCMDIFKTTFYGKNIFITGGSGFIGKAIIEKLLRSCPDLEKIYILIRPKKGKCVEERLELIKSSPVFNVLKEKQPDIFKKIVPITGDINQLELGLSKEDQNLLKSRINIFFNAAASVKFDDSFKNAVFTNLRSAREAARLALQMDAIEVFLHVSTTYCNLDDRKVIDEKLYPAGCDWKDVISCAENSDSRTLDILSGKLLSGFPNTYTFTKRLAEHVINDLLVNRIPTIISRPSIVVSPIEEPMEGWTDNFNGPVAILIGGATALLRIFYADPNADCDFNFVDNTVKSMIVSVWHKANFSEASELSIYHQSKNYDFRFTMGDVIENGKKIAWEIPFENKIWYPNASITTCWYNFYINMIIFQLIPAIFLDLILMICGYSSMIFRRQRQIYLANTAISYFTLNEWKFQAENGLKLFSTLAESEKRSFNFLISPHDPKAAISYLFGAALYSKQYLLKETRQITEENRSRTLRLYVLDQAIKVSFWIILVWIVLFKSSVPTQVCKYLHIFTK